MWTQLKTGPAEDAITLQEIKTAIFNNTTQDDDYLTALIPTITAWVEDYTGRKLITQDWYVYYSLPEFQKMMDIYTFNTQSINEVLFYNREGASELIDPSNYDLSNDQIVWSDNYSPSSSTSLRSNDAIRIDVTVGYGDSRDDIPPEIRQAMNIFAQHQKSWTTNAIEFKGNGAFKKVPDGLDSLLRSYRKRNQWL